MTSSLGGGISNPHTSTPGKIMHPMTPYKIGQAMQNQTRVIKGPQAERNLANLKKPMVFQCQQCKVIIGNSNQLKQWKRLKDNSFLIFQALDRKTISISKDITTQMKGSFCYCSYRSIMCSNCNSKIGMYFLSTTSANQKFLKNFTIIEQSIIRYDLGDTIQVETGSNIGISSSNKHMIDEGEQKEKIKKSFKMEDMDDKISSNAQNYNLINLPDVQGSIGSPGSIEEEVKLALMQQKKNMLRQEQDGIFRDDKDKLRGYVQGELYDKMTSGIDHLKDWVGKFNSKLDMSQRQMRKYFQEF